MLEKDREYATQLRHHREMQSLMASASTQMPSFGSNNKPTNQEPTRVPNNRSFLQNASNGYAITDRPLSEDMIAKYDVMKLQNCSASNV